MSKVASGWFLTVAMVIALGTGFGRAAEVEYMTRAQWLRKVGPSVTSAAVLRETLAKVSPSDRVEFEQRLLKAITRMPVKPEEKAAAYITVACLCLASAPVDAKGAVLAEVFAGVPIEYLPVVTGELAKRCAKEYGSLPALQYEAVVGGMLKTVFARNETTDAPSVRDTFALLVFVNSETPPALQATVMALLPNDRVRGLAESWIAPAKTAGNYDAMLAAADAPPLVLAIAEVQQLVSVSVPATLVVLAEPPPTPPGTPPPTTPDPEGETVPITDSLPGMNDTDPPPLPPSDFGTDPKPEGYQNQSTDINGK